MRTVISAEVGFRLFSLRGGPYQLEIAGTFLAAFKK